MTVPGVTTTPSSRCYFSIPKQRPKSLDEKASLDRRCRVNMGVLYPNRNFYGFSTRRHFIKCAMDASYGDATNDPTAIFPRINVRDPYKRLGISKEASEEEIQGARNFLIQKYAGHKPSVDAIESAHDKIIMQKFHERRSPKINIKKKVREMNQSRVLQAVRSRFQTPSTKFIVKTAIVFLVLGALSVVFPTEDGPTFQVAISLIATIYFIHDRLKSKLRALLYGVGAFIVSWLLGTFLMVSVIPPILKGPRSLEVTTSDGGNMYSTTVPRLRNDGTTKLLLQDFLNHGPNQGINQRGGTFFDRCLGDPTLN